MEPGACNYSSLATIDDGSCCHWVDCGGTGSDSYFDCERCGCVDCPASDNPIFDSSGLHRCCPGGADYGTVACGQETVTS